MCCKRVVDDQGSVPLGATQRAFNLAATGIARGRWHEGVTSTSTAHHLVYGETRLVYGLGAQLA
jgi:hypothetical protein